MTYKKESDELIKWYAEENRKISEKMRGFPKKKEPTMSKRRKQLNPQTIRGHKKGE